jgi:hypothetical protein
MPDVTFITSRALLQDSIEYTISVYKSTAGFFAFGDCKKCNREGSASSPVPDRDSAISACQVLIDQHHARHHAVETKS